MYKRGDIVRVPIGSGAVLLGQITKREDGMFFVGFYDFHDVACPSPRWLRGSELRPIKLSEPLTEKDRDWNEYPLGTEVVSAGGTFTFRKAERGWIRDLGAAFSKEPDSNFKSIRVPVKK